MNLTGYLGIGALIAIMAVGLWGYHYKVAARDAVAAQHAAERDRDAAVAVNKHNEEVMGKLKADKEHADRLAADLADDMAKANNDALAASKALAELRAKNADVDNYLNLPVPGDLRRLYPNAKAQGSH